MHVHVSTHVVLWVGGHDDNTDDTLQSNYGLESQLRANDVCMEQRRNARVEEREIPHQPTASSRRPGTKIRVISAVRGLAQPTKILKDGLEAAWIPNCAVLNYNDTQWAERHDCVAEVTSREEHVAPAVETRSGEKAQASV
ncbi:hypothetical protein PR048_011048 [Dryococelus australis]|uniref:Uncharacterized protein n=1 Tax=Dryococelus australis TaxID=614101 RepID=A0ABQ9HKK1_9NEOP|nr:hypothetical protein PR048_011048 [Dryococelus australis]